jgi:predicted nucleic acid-binding protein
MPSGANLAVVDAGPLYAAVDADDQNHEIALDVLGRANLRLVIPAMVVTEVTYLISRHLGTRVESQFLASLADFDVQASVVRTHQWFP